MSNGIQMTSLNCNLGFSVKHHAVHTPDFICIWVCNSYSVYPKILVHFQTLNTKCFGAFAISRMLPLLPNITFKSPLQWTKVLKHCRRKKKKKVASMQTKDKTSCWTRFACSYLTAAPLDQEYYTIYGPWARLQRLTTTVLAQKQIKTTSKMPTTQTYLFYSLCALIRIALLNFQQVHILVGTIHL